MSQLFDQIAASTPSYVNHYVDMSFDIADQIHAILSNQGRTQKDLAEALGKRESEISKWLSGTHNFTLKTLSKISTELGVELISVNTNYHFFETREIVEDFDWEELKAVEFSEEGLAELEKYVEKEGEDAKIIPLAA